MSNPDNLEDIITFLYRQVTTKNDAALVKDTTRLSKIKYDAYIDSSISNPLSFTVFNLSDKGELLIDNPTRIVDSEAAFFLFINAQHGWVFAIKNTLENQKKLIRKEPIQNYKIKFLD
ncbi:hypothetical protein IJ182_03120 [bacterium]|nr:hypothetical protein [bacterium]